MLFPTDFKTCQGTKQYCSRNKNLVLLLCWIVRVRTLLNPFSTSTVSYGTIVSYFVSKSLVPQLLLQCVANKEIRYDSLLVCLLCI